MGFIKHNDVVCRRCLIAERGVEEMMDGLNESPDGAATGANPCPRVGALCPVEIIAGQRFPQHGQLEPPHRVLLGGERLAMRAHQRRIDLVIAGTEKSLEPVGVKASVQTRTHRGGDAARSD
jgi:hypothetical protein